LIKLRRAKIVPILGVGASLYIYLIALQRDGIGILSESVMSMACVSLCRYLRSVVCL